MKSQTQRALLLGFIISIGCCGLVGIYCLLVGQFGSFEGGVLGSTAAIGAASILALAGAVPWERRRWHPIGPISIATVAVALVLVLVAIWAEVYQWIRDLGEGFFKTMGVACVLSVALPHAGLMSLARLGRRYEWLRRWTVVAISLLSALMISVIIAEPRAFDIWVRCMGILGIAAACGTIAVPIMHRVSAIRVREAVKTTELSLSLTCPRCGSAQRLPAGRSKCAQCGLRFLIEIEEESCRSCGYPLYRLTSTTCPECGTAIAKE